MAGEETADGKPWARKVADTSENRKKIATAGMYIAYLEVQRWS